ncbi:MAG: ribosome silencing factor [Elusimicrobia bacterium]|nr:ribosome silencing factor [Elusimicrobiota bacterium]
MTLDALSRRRQADARTLAKAAAQAAAEKKGEDIALLNITRFSALADYLLIVSAASPAHLSALEEKIEQSLEALGICVSRRDGRQSGSWRVLDYGALMIHLMRPEAREFYGLERLFRGARKVRLQNA